MSSPLVVLGGMFDPVHKGHVSAANYALEFLSAHRLKMVPCHGLIIRPCLILEQSTDWRCLS